jgi:hypothetical protein
MSAAAVVGIVAAVVSTTVSTTLAVRQSNTEEDYAKYAARLSRDKAAEEEAAFRRKANLELGRERAQLGKLGIIPTAGSPLEQLARNAGEVERGAVLVRRGLLEEASLYEINAAAISSQRGLLAASNVLSGIGAAARAASPLLQRKPPPPSGNSAGSPYTNTRGAA